MTYALLVKPLLPGVARGHATIESRSGRSQQR
jgi:hypothetical protein